MGEYDRDAVYSVWLKDGSKGVIFEDGRMEDRMGYRLNRSEQIELIESYEKRELEKLVDKEVKRRLSKRRR